MIGWCFSISQSQPSFLLKAFLALRLLALIMHTPDYYQIPNNKTCSIIPPIPKLSTCTFHVWENALWTIITWLSSCGVVNEIYLTRRSWRWETTKGHQCISNYEEKSLGFSCQVLSVNSLAPGRCDSNFKGVIYVWTQVGEHFLRNCSQVNVTEYIWWGNSCHARFIFGNLEIIYLHF